MKHCFVINPAAGSGKEQEVLLPRIINAAKSWGADYEIHRTSGPGEAVTYARAMLEEHKEETVRFYSCGGDGSASEILNGIYGAENAELSIIPAGSGNDYIRNFADKECFCDIMAEIAGEAVPVDVIEYTYTPYDKEDSGEITSYALNMINMGFDAKVVRHMEKMKNKFFLKGTGAYVAGVVMELAGYKMSKAVFRLEGEDEFETELLLGGVGSGRFSGGGFDGIPPATVNDGLLDIMLIQPISRGKFIRLVGAYHDGKHIDSPLLAEQLYLNRTKHLEIEPLAPLVFTADGEILLTAKRMTISLAPKRISFVIPDGADRP